MKIRSTEVRRFNGEKYYRGDWSKSKAKVKADAKYIRGTLRRSARVVPETYDGVKGYSIYVR